MAWRISLVQRFGSRAKVLPNTAMTGFLSGCELRVRGLRKSFGETQALVAVDLACTPGTVHTILGENGSGKSTLVKILSGVIPPDGGEVVIGGSPMTTFSPQAARQRGIATVFQEVLVAPNRSVLDNIFLGFDGLFRRRLSRGQREELAHRVLKSITDTPVPLHQRVEMLPLPQQQLVVIARALVRDPAILILDEATAALDVSDRKILFDAIRALVTSGRIVIFISHRMDEVLELSDEVTVLRNGRSIATLPRTDLSAATLFHLMSPDVPALGGVDV